MVDCVDILRSITKSCGDNVGGVNKRVWITQLQQIERYTFDSLGYVNSITTKEIGATNYGYELKKVISKKGSHSGNVEAIENVNVDVFKHTAILKAYATTPEQRDSLVSLYGASKVVVFFETDNGEIEIYGLENGLYATALTGNTGEQMQDDTAFTFTLSGLQTSLPKYFLYGGSLATSIAYLDEIGLTPIYEIESFTSGTSTIDFTNNGGDDWTVDFFINPTSLQVPSGVTVDTMDLTISHWVAGVENNLDSQLINTDYTYNATGNGAGVYALFAHYNLSDGSEFQVYRLVKVDGSGNILISLEIKGIIVNSVNGLTMNVTASVVQTGASYDVLWVELPSGTQVGTGTTASVTLSSSSTQLAFTLDVDSAITTDMTDPFGALATISIN